MLILKILAVCTKYCKMFQINFDFRFLFAEIPEQIPQGHSKFSQSSRVELLAKIGSNSKSSTISAKTFISDDQMGSEYTFVCMLNVSIKDRSSQGELFYERADLKNFVRSIKKRFGRFAECSKKRLNCRCFRVKFATFYRTSHRILANFCFKELVCLTWNEHLLKAI